MGHHLEQEGSVLRQPTFSINHNFSGFDPKVCPIECLGNDLTNDLTRTIKPRCRKTQTPTSQKEQKSGGGKIKKLLVTITSQSRNHKDGCLIRALSSRDE